MKLCECGCGEPTPIAKYTDRRKGHVLGEQVRFVSGHNSRGLKRSPETRKRMSEAAKARDQTPYCGPRGCKSKAPHRIHSWINTWYPRKGVCQECGAVGKTDYAFLKHPSAYTVDPHDYREMCRRCHVSFDVATGVRPTWEELRAKRPLTTSDGVV